MQHHLKMFIYIMLPLCDLNKSPGVCDVWVNRWYESTQAVLSNHKWNKRVSTITSLRLDLLLRVHQPYLCLLYVWVQKQVTERSREITYGLDQRAVVKYLGKSSLSHPISLSKEDRRESERVTQSERHGLIRLAEMKSIKNHLGENGGLVLMPAPLHQL